MSISWRMAEGDAWDEEAFNRCFESSWPYILANSNYATREEAWEAINGYGRPQAGKLRVYMVEDGERIIGLRILSVEEDALLAEGGVYDADRNGSRAWILKRFPLDLEIAQSHGLAKVRYVIKADSPNDRLMQSILTDNDRLPPAVRIERRLYPTGEFAVWEVE